MTKILWVMAIIVIGYVGYQAYRINNLRHISLNLVAETITYQQQPDDPTARILIIGDSLQAGVGASSPETSMAGLLGQDYPDWEIVNLAESGDETEDALNKLESLDRRDFDLAIIQIGANDIFHRINLQKSVDNLRQVLELSGQKADRVIYMTSGSVGYAPLFPLSLDLYFTNRSRQATPKFIQVAESLDLEVVDNYREREFDIFEQNPDRYYAADKFHLSDAGYQVWYDRLKNQLDQMTIEN